MRSLRLSVLTVEVSISISACSSSQAKTKLLSKALILNSRIVTSRPVRSYTFLIIIEITNNQMLYLIFFQ